MSGTSRVRAIVSHSSLTQFGTFVIPSVFLGLILYRDIPDLLWSPFLRESVFGLYLFAIPLTFIEIVGPVIIVFWCYPKVSAFRRDVVGPWPVLITLVIRFFGYLGIVLVAFIPFAMGCISEFLFPFSVLPLVEVVCGLLWLPIGASLLRGSGPSRRQILLAAAFCLILLGKFADWNSRRPFIRDLLRIREGMTVEQVDNVMARYMTGTRLAWPPISDDKPKSSSSISPATSQTVKKGPDNELNLTDSNVYRHSNEGAYNADWGIVRFHEGKVESVDYMPD